MFWWLRLATLQAVETIIVELPLGVLVADLVQQVSELIGVEQGFIAKMLEEVAQSYSSHLLDSCYYY